MSQQQFLIRCPHLSPVFRWATAGLTLALLLPVSACRDELTAPAPKSELDMAASAVLSFRLVSAGTHHSCGVTTDNLAYCWGLNSHGQLGDGTTTQRERPVKVLGGLHFLLVSAGSGHTCALTTDYRAYCWGWNDRGALGDGSDRALARRPVAVAGDRRYQDISAGDTYSCAVTRSDRAFCWGFNHLGQLGDGSRVEERHIPSRVAGGLSFLTVDAGGTHTCGVTLTHKAYCWGLNEFGDVGDNTTTPRRAPVAVAGGRSFTHVAAGDRHSCGVITAADAFCWGWNLYGQLGDGTRIDRQVPVKVIGDLAFTQISGGGAHSCAVRTDQGVSCWGHNSFGQLGNGTTADYTVPVTAGGSLRFRQVSTGISHTCAVGTDNRAYCWGYGGTGQVGDGTSSVTNSWPVAVAGPI
jgi:alpha-tubulin suppressor-like RCC1 family protein